MAPLTKSAVRRLFTRLFGTKPPAEEIGTTSAGKREEFPAHPSDRAGRPAWTRWTVMTLMSVGLLSMVVAVAVIVDPPPLPSAPRNPCAAGPMTDVELVLLADRRWPALQPALQERLRREPFLRTDQALQDKVDAAFEPIYARIPTFLDWHYSLTGQYTQLAWVILEWLESEIAPTVRDRLRSQLAQAILDRLLKSDLARAIDQLRGSESVRAALDRLQQGVESRLFGDLTSRLENASDHIESVMRDEMSALVEKQIRAEAQTLAAPAYAETWTPCLDRDAYERMLRAVIPETVRRFTNSAVPTSIIAVGAAYRGAAAARTLVSGLSRRLLSRLAARAIGLLAGPAAWLLMDVVVLFADEYFNRDELEAELTALIDEQKAEVKAALSEAVAHESEALGKFLPSELDDRRRSP